MRADGTALVMALRTWASLTEPPVRNTASISPALRRAWVRQFLMRSAIRSASCLVWLTRSGRRELQNEVEEWRQTTEIMARFLEAKAEEL